MSALLYARGPPTLTCASPDVSNVADTRHRKSFVSLRLALVPRRRPRSPRPVRKMSVQWHLGTLVYAWLAGNLLESAIAGHRAPSSRLIRDHPSLSSQSSATGISVVSFSHADIDETEDTSIVRLEASTRPVGSDQHDTSVMCPSRLAGAAAVSTWRENRGVEGQTGSRLVRSSISLLYRFIMVAIILSHG